LGCLVTATGNIKGSLHLSSLSDIKLQGSGRGIKTEKRKAHLPKGILKLTLFSCVLGSFELHLHV
jgi:hypothetical protein